MGFAAQIVVVTHALELRNAITAAAERRNAMEQIEHVALEKHFGETRVEGQEGLLDRPSWHWPNR